MGDQLDLICSAPDSKPATVLDWIINDSLNLSAASSTISSIDGIEQWPVLEVSARRLVRLSTSINGSIGERGAQVGHQLLSQSPNLLTYELVLNNTKAVPYQWPPGNLSPPQPIGLAGSVLDQIPEQSISRLNFTIDTNLIQRLDLTGSKNRQKPERRSNSMLRLKEIKTRLSPSQETTETVGEERFISLGADTPRVLGQTRGDVTSLSDVKRTLIRRFANKHPASSNSSLRAGWTRTQPISSKGAIPMNDKLSIKIECVSRFLHWTLSDTIRILINTKKRVESGNDLEAVTAQKRQRPNGKSSGKLEISWSENKMSYRTNQYIQILIFQSAESLHLAARRSSIVLAISFISIYFASERMRIDF